MFKSLIVSLIKEIDKTQPYNANKKLIKSGYGVSILLDHVNVSTLSSISYFLTCQVLTAGYW